MNGRLGNQMFRYAFARMLQLQSEEKEEPLIFDFSNIWKEKKKEEMPGWEDSLKEFCVVAYSYYEGKKSILMQETTIMQKLVLGIVKAGDRLVRKKGTLSRIRWRKRFFRWMNRQGIYQMFTGYDYPYVWVAGKKILCAPFECARFPESIRKELLQEFVPKHPVLAKNKELLERICTSESVCVSVRRGNYLAYPGLNVCTVEYFERAAEKMCSMVERPIFFVFSDDVEWIRRNLCFPGETYYEEGADPAWEKLRLMYSCRHFIISNSTFSWWAQFLGQFPDKKVIAPDRWYNDEYVPPLYEDGWVTVEV
ncbi:MAG: alpha-1,2-fucosyltransferase [Blautia sp.]|nr:alpha-1,2-fucosyltransferase [Blautia sp.]